MDTYYADPDNQPAPEDTYDMTEPYDPTGAALDAHPFFCYGTLRPGMGNHGRWLGLAVAEHDGAATLTRLALHSNGGFPYGVCTGDADDVTVGVVIRPGPGHYQEVLDRLDRLEGYPSHYDRIVAQVETPDGPLDCWVYVTPDDDVSRRRAVSLPSVPGNDWTNAVSRWPR